MPVGGVRVIIYQELLARYSGVASSQSMPFVPNLSCNLFLPLPGSCSSKGVLIFDHQHRGNWPLARLYVSAGLFVGAGAGE